MKGRGKPPGRGGGSGKGPSGKGPAGGRPSGRPSAGKGAAAKRPVGPGRSGPPRGRSSDRPGADRPFAERPREDRVRADRPKRDDRFRDDGPRRDDRPFRSRRPGADDRPARDDRPNRTDRPFRSGPAASPAGDERRPTHRGRRPDGEGGVRSFDGAPRRGRDDDWGVEEAGWSPEDDLDIAAIEEPSAPRRKADLREERPRTDRPSRPERRDDGRERPLREQPRGSGPSRDDRHRRPPTPTGPTRAELKAAATTTLQTGVQTLTVTADETDMRVDRFLAARFPQLSFSYIQRIVRKGELRVNGKRAETKDRLEEGQAVRVPPLKLDQARPMSAKVGEDVAGFLASITLYEDADLIVFAKPAGLSVQGGSGTKKHLDGMLAVLTDADGQRPRLVHRLDKDTSGCLLVAKSRFAAAALAKTFRTRAARKIYWSVVAGVPKPRQGRVSTYLAKEEREDESFMRLAKHGEKGASHAVSYYAVIDTMAQKLSWLSMKPVTGRTHQLRVHAAEIGHPILGDPKYFKVENWEIPGGIQHKLHLHARRIVVPHPRGKGTIDVSAPLPPHMEQTFNLLGWDVSRYDPIVEAPEE
jgi:23S rRNA pseudouridine955/2504/2580 synthase